MVPDPGPLAQAAAPLLDGVDVVLVRPRAGAPGGGPTPGGPGPGATGGAGRAGGQGVARRGRRPDAGGRRAVAGGRGRPRPPPGPAGQVVASGATSCRPAGAARACGSPPPRVRSSSERQVAAARELEKRWRRWSGCSSSGAPGFSRSTNGAARPGPSCRWPALADLPRGSTPSAPGCAPSPPGDRRATSEGTPSSPHGRRRRDREIPGLVGTGVGVADGLFAALLAAGLPPTAGPWWSPRGDTPFLAPWPVATLDRAELADLLGRLGIRTLGDFAALPAPGCSPASGPRGPAANGWPRASKASCPASACSSPPEPGRSPDAGPATPPPRRLLGGQRRGRRPGCAGGRRVQAPSAPSRWSGAGCKGGAARRSVPGSSPGPGPVASPATSRTGRGRPAHGDSG